MVGTGGLDTCYILMTEEVTAKVHFKANFHKRTAKPEDWDDLFKKFPVGHGIIKDKKFNPNNERSVFDSDWVS